jgi:hypothetical protein
VLEDGWLNEFRYLDDNMTIPLSVPVTAGQNIMITLEYANPTSVGGGNSASVVRDINGCQSGRNVLYAIPGGWLNFCLFLSGDLVIRAVLDTTPAASTVTCSLTCNPPGCTVGCTRAVESDVHCTHPSTPVEQTVLCLEGDVRRSPAR